jgi:hypothetical protein
VREIAAVFAVVLLLLAVLFLPDIFSSLHLVQVSTTTESGNVTTAGGVTAGNLTLSEEMYRGAISSVSGLTSTNSNDNPYSVSYSEATQTLEVDGLQAGASRVLSAEYEFINPSNLSNMAAVATLLGVVIVLGLIILMVVVPGGAIVSVWARFRG